MGCWVWCPLSSSWSGQVTLMVWMVIEWLRWDFRKQDQHQQMTANKIFTTMETFHWTATWILCVSTLSRLWHLNFSNETQNFLCSAKKTLDHLATVQFFFFSAQKRCFWHCPWFRSGLTRRNGTSVAHVQDFSVCSGFSWADSSLTQNLKFAGSSQVACQSYEGCGHLLSSSSSSSTRVTLHVTILCCLAILSPTNLFQLLISCRLQCWYNSPPECFYRHS